MEAIRSGAKNLESYYSAINDQQIAENKLLKEANQGLQSLMRPLFAENAALKQEVAERTEELVELRKEQKRWGENLQNIRRIVSTCRAVEELAGLLLTPSEQS
jgi:predicted nuclease with TOPRIM domain